VKSRIGSRSPGRGGNCSIDLKNNNLLVEDRPHAQHLVDGRPSATAAFATATSAPAGSWCGDMILTDQVTNISIEYNLIHDNLQPSQCAGRAQTTPST